jgi:DNA-directed RNA polymerase subunit F
MLSNFEPKKITEAKDILSKRLNIAHREREADIESQKKSIFEYLLEFKDSVVKKLKGGNNY